MNNLCFEVVTLLMAFPASICQQEPTKDGLIARFMCANDMCNERQPSQTNDAPFSKTANTSSLFKNEFHGNQPNLTDKVTFEKAAKSFSRRGASHYFPERDDKAAHSVAKRAATPQLQRLPNGQWNCSVSNIRPPQSRCNLTTECAGGEDELDCPYSGHCGTGYLTIDGRCYLFAVKRLSWYEADEACQSEGGRLASLNTKEEWDRVTAVTDMATARGGPRNEEIHFLVGLSESLPILPQYDTIVHDVYDTGLGISVLPQE